MPNNIEMPLEVHLEFPINLDDVTIESREDFRRTFALLADYCEFKSDAARLRLVGLIVQAGALEGRCEVIYNRLPPWARW